jgi:hypothetical protein
VGRVKEEVDRLLKAGFIQPCRYAEWVSNVVPVEKKGTGKIRVMRGWFLIFCEVEVGQLVISMLVKKAPNRRS